MPFLYSNTDIIHIRGDFHFAHLYSYPHLKIKISDTKVPHIIFILPCNFSWLLIVLDKFLHFFLFMITEIEI